MKKSIGIIGGMGPMATCDLMKKIIENTDAACDQAHIRLYVDSNTNIPDRTANRYTNRPLLFRLGLQRYVFFCYFQIFCVFFGEKFEF